MSPRAAWRLEALGFGEVYDYESGKADWRAAGLPREGRTVGQLTAGDAANRDAPTCGIADDLQSVRERVRRTGWSQCIVINDQHVVLGRLGKSVLADDDEKSVEDAMDSGPSTVRPTLGVDELYAQLQEKKLRFALVTTNDGRLVGVVLHEP
jgi:CBS domain-containing protein